MYNSQIKAIPTRYNGNEFRSRLEARWAVFFDQMGIKYEYEGEGYECHFPSGFHLNYLPDFKLKNVVWSPLNERCRKNTGCVFVEVKGVDAFDEIKREDRLKMEAFAMHYPLIVLGNLPKDIDEVFSYRDALSSYVYLDGTDCKCFFADGGTWAAGQICLSNMARTRRGGREKIDDALAIARMAKFEFNEPPGTDLALISTLDLPF